jgi:CDP-diacylglycerol--glycerol-3-phosphate 3-phosphatidyltransferase
MTAEPALHDTSPLRRHLPNALTVLRLFLAAAFFVILTPWTVGDRLLHEAVPHTLSTPNWTLLSAAALVVLGAATDALDGHLARRWNVTSPFGRIMDPFADKVLVVGAFIILAGPTFHFGTDVRGHSATDFQVSGVEPWMVVVALARELLVTSIRGYAEARGVAFPADWSGKAKMVLQAVAVPLILATLALTDARVETRGRVIVLVTVWVTVGVTVISGIPYVVRASRALGSGGRG